MRIGDFARLGNVSLRTLRFYGQTGLLPPAYVNSANGYRHYESRQLQHLHQIQALKEMGLSLEEIRKLMARRPAAAELRSVFRLKRDALLKHMEEDKLRLERIETRMRRLEDKFDGREPEVVLSESRPVWVVSLREKIHRYEEAEGMFQEIERRFDRNLFCGKRGALWHSCANESRTIDCEVFRPLRRPVSARHGMNTYELPATTVASIFHAGSDLTLHRSYDALVKWLASSRFQLIGPKREIYWVESGEESESLTQIQFPVVPARGAKRGEHRSAV